MVFRSACDRKVWREVLRVADELEREIQPRAGNLELGQGCMRARQLQPQIREPRTRPRDPGDERLSAREPARRDGDARVVRRWRRTPRLR
jgi:hypothetical protein